LKLALQYSATPGLPTLLGRLRVKRAKSYLTGPPGLMSPLSLKALQEDLHSPRYANWDVIVTAGRVDGLSKAVDMLLEHNDAALAVGEHAPAAFLAAANVYNPNYLIVEEDEEGLRPDELEAALASRCKLFGLSRGS